MITYKLLLPDRLKETYEKVAEYLPDIWKDAASFYTLYQSVDSAFFEVGNFDGVFWLTGIIPGWKATGHVVLWSRRVLKQHIRAKEVIRELFSLYSLKRLDSYIPIRLRGAQRYAERLGLSLEGVLRKQALFNGGPEDIAVYSLIKEDL